MATLPGILIGLIGHFLPEQGRAVLAAVAQAIAKLFGSVLP